MLKNKKLVAICLLGAMLVPQVNVKAISNKENINIELGDIYEKTVIKLMGRTSLSDKDREVMSDEKIKQIEESDKEKETMEVLVPKTNSNYEVALAYDDGNYRYINSVDNFDEAVEIANESKEASLVKSSNSSIIPAVIDSKGSVVYATESVGRAWKHYADNKTADIINGKEVKRDMNIYLYNSSNLSQSNECSYFSDGNISELPLINQIGGSAQCYVSGKIGWTNTNENRDVRGCGHNNRDILIKPVNQVINPSYYVVRDGILHHWVAKSMDTPKDNKGSGFDNIVGLPPSYLIQDKKYFSYDGNYFYDAKNGTAATLSLIVSDLKSGNFEHAVNNGNPYYGYFKYLPFRSKTNYTGEQLNSYIKYYIQTNKVYNSKLEKSKLIGLGPKFVEAQNNYGVNALLALSIAINESGGGTSDIAFDKNNLFGINATDRNPGKDADYFRSPEACVEEFAKTLISSGYADTADWRNYGGFLGNKGLGANVKYASDPYWGDTAASIAFKIDNYLSGGKLSNLKDYDNYQLIRYSGSNSVLNYNKGLLYKVFPNINVEKGYFVGGIEALSTTDKVSIDGTSCYEIYPSRTTPINEGGTANRFIGKYDWNIRGYVPCNNVQYLNKARRNWSSADVNKDGKISMLDLTLEAQYYNKNTIKSNIDLDVNRDGIIDIYDIVRVSCKL